MRTACTDTRQVDNTDGNHEPASYALYGLVGVILFVLGGSLLANLNDDSDLGLVGGLLLVGLGIYNMITGAVARAIEVARR